MKKRNALSEYRDGIRSGDRVCLAQAITLAESTLPDDQHRARELIQEVLPYTGQSIRIGITGVPGVGKSTFIEAFGLTLIARGHRVAVLTVDPSSRLTRGSILGDKTRMNELARHSQAFIRPSSAGTSLGGVTGKTREAMLLCEAAGFDVVLVETVGVGQSEVEVRNMVDFFLLLMLAGAGDELQGIKKGIMEMADALVITKADGINIAKAKEAQADYQQALHLLRTGRNGWIPQVKTCSSTEGSGIDAIWEMIEDFQQKSKESGTWENLRSEQAISWMHQYLNDLIQQHIMNAPPIVRQLETLKQEVINNKLLPLEAAEAAYAKIIREFGSRGS